MKRTRSIAYWLSKILIFLGFAVFSVFATGTLVHRYPKHFSVLGLLFPALMFLWLLFSVKVRKRAVETSDVKFGISEAGMRVLRSPDNSTLIPWDQISSVWYSKTLGIMVVRSSLLNGRHTISRKHQKLGEDGAFEKAAIFIKKSIASRWHESWI